MSNTRPLFDEIRNSNLSEVEGFISVWLEDEKYPHFHLIEISSIKSIVYFYCLYEITIDHENGQVRGMLDESQGGNLFDILRSIKNKSGCLIHLKSV